MKLAAFGKEIKTLSPAEMITFETTTYKTIVGQRLLIGTAVVMGITFFIAVFIDKDFAKFLVESWLYFMAIGVLGGNVAQYGLQRFSSKELQEAKARGEATAAAQEDLAESRRNTREHNARRQPAADIEHADEVNINTEENNPHIKPRE